MSQNMDTTYLKVTVKAESPRDSVTERNGRYIVATREPAQNGRANASATKILAEYLGIPHNKLSLVRGSDKPAKLFIKRE